MYIRVQHIKRTELNIFFFFKSASKSAAQSILAWFTTVKVFLSRTFLVVNDLLQYLTGWINLLGLVGNERNENEKKKMGQLRQNLQSSTDPYLSSFY